MLRAAPKAHSCDETDLCTHADNQGSAVRDVGAAEQGSSVSGDTAATTDDTTVLSPTDDSSDSDAGVAVTDSEVAAAPGSEEPMLAPAPGLAPVAAPAPVLSPVAVNPALGSYDPPMPLPVIPVAAAVLPSGQVCSWRKTHKMPDAESDVLCLCFWGLPLHLPFRLIRPRCIMWHKYYTLGRT